MAQKVITVTGFADAPSGRYFQELDFPKVSAALIEGYEVINVYQTSMGDKVGWFIVTFILEKYDGDGLLADGNSEDDDLETGEGGKEYSEPTL